MSEGEDLKKYIYNNLNLKDTDDLVDIWITNNRLEWSDLAFGVLSDLLIERIGKLPPQDAPITVFKEHDRDNLIANYDEEGPPVERAKPSYYSSEQVIRFCIWLDRTAIIAVVVFVLLNYQQYGFWHELLMSFVANDPQWSITMRILAFIPFGLSVLIQAIFIYFPLRGLSNILKILMEMEHRYRDSWITGDTLDMG